MLEMDDQVKLEMERSLSPDGYDANRRRSRSPIKRSRSRSRSRSRDHRRDNRDRPSVRSRRVYICNVPYDMKWQAVKDLFRKEVGEVAFVEMIMGPDDKPKGAGIIEFGDCETAAKAIDKMNRYDIKDRKLVVREAHAGDIMALDRSKANSMMGGGGGGGGGGPGPPGPGLPLMGMGMGGGGGGGGMGMRGGGGGGGMSGDHGLSPQVIQQLGIDGPVTNTVVVTNLAYNVGRGKLMEVFQLAGNVVEATIRRDKDGKSRGIAIVEFENIAHAVQAISMFNNQELFDRTMRVKMDSYAVKEPPPPQLPAGLKGIGMGLGIGGSLLPPRRQLDGGMGMDNLGAQMDRAAGILGSGAMGNMGGLGSSLTGLGGGGLASSLGSSLGGAGMDLGMGTSGLGMGSGGMAGSLGMSGLGTSGLGGSGLGNMGLGTGLSGLGGMGLSRGGGMGESLSGMGSGQSGYDTGIGAMGSSGLGLLGSGGGSGGLGGMGMDMRSSGLSGGHQGGGGRYADQDTTVLVKNLPYSFTWQMLKERFRDVGEVKFAEIKMENGKSKGWGTVRFVSHADAVRSVSLMHRVRIEGREIVVRMDK